MIVAISKLNFPGQKFEMSARVVMDNCRDDTVEKLATKSEPAEVGKCKKTQLAKHSQGSRAGPTKKRKHHIP